MALDPATHKFYVAAAKYGPPPAEGRGRGAIIPGSMTVLVYGLNGK